MEKLGSWSKLKFGAGRKRDSSSLSYAQTKGKTSRMPNLMKISKIYCSRS